MYVCSWRPKKRLALDNVAYEQDAEWRASLAVIQSSCKSLPCMPLRHCDTLGRHRTDYKELGIICADSLPWDLSLVGLTVLAVGEYQATLCIVYLECWEWCLATAAIKPRVTCLHWYSRFLSATSQSIGKRVWLDAVNCVKPKGNNTLRGVGREKSDETEKRTDQTNSLIV